MLICTHILICLVEGKSRILHTYREKKLWKEKIFVNKDFSEETTSTRKGLYRKQKPFDHRTR